MEQDIFEWVLLLVRWLHITVAVTWIGTSIFFMWLDRSFVFNEKSQNPGHVGDLWMVHGGGFYHVEKLLMGPTKVPDHLHWFKWESYWTWMSGVMLIALIFYTGDGTFLLDSTISSISFSQAIILSIFSIIGSWLFYDFLWERHFIKSTPWIGHTLTMLWFAGMSYLLCHTLSGRAAYVHIGAMLGTWMTANVFMRIIPRQIKMVEASKKGEPVNQDWGKNAKNRSTHNTYFTLPVIFIMLSNHFPQTYGHDQNWLILLLVSGAGAAIREYFVVRLKNPKRSYSFILLGILLLIFVIVFFREENQVLETHEVVNQSQESVLNDKKAFSPLGTSQIKGVVRFEGVIPPRQKLILPGACSKLYKGEIFSNEILIKNNFIENVLIRITKGNEGKTFELNQIEPAILDQKGCLYHPRVIGVRVGQKVNFVNSDEIFHNVRSITTENQKFNMAMPRKNQTEVKIFNKPEIFMQAKCSVHPWMGAYIAIMDHPFFDVTKEDGSFEIKQLPEGKYKIEAWHEVFGKLENDIEIKNQETLNLNFTFKGAP